jgi:hypothetical protein
VNEVGGFEDPHAVGINRDDDDIGGLGGRIRDHERPPGSSENRCSNGGYEHAGGARQHNHWHDRNPSSPLRGHLLHDGAMARMAPVAVTSCNGPFSDS